MTLMDAIENIRFDVLHTYSGFMNWLHDHGLGIAIIVAASVAFAWTYANRGI